MLLAGYFGAFFLLWFLKWEIQTRESWIEETHLNKRYLRRPERTLIFSLKYKYRVSSNNSRPFNRLPWIIAPLCRKCLKLPPPSNNPPPHHPSRLPARVTHSGKLGGWSQEGVWSSTTDQWRFKLWRRRHWHWKLINEGTKFGTL